MRRFLVTFITFNNEHEQFKFVAETTGEADSISHDYMTKHDYEDYVFEQVNKEVFAELDVPQLEINNTDADDDVLDIC